MSKDFPVKGLKELDTYLSHLPMNMQKGAFRSALVAAAAPIRDEARLRAPKKTGKMAKSIKTGSARQNQDGTFSVEISLKGDHAFLGVFHEYGVKAHFISAGDSGMSPRLLSRAAGRGDVTGDVERQAMKIGDNYITGTIMHPGHAAQPFMRPALDAKAEEALQAFAAKLRAYLEGKTGLIVPMGEAA